MLAHAVARKALPFLLAMAALPGFIRGATAASPQSADVRVIYWVDKTFGASYVSNIMLTNMTPDPIEEWSLGFDQNPPVDNVRNATLSLVGNRHTITGAGWTHRIEPGQSVFFSLDGTIPGDGNMTNANDVPRPSSCAFNGQTCSFEEQNAPPRAQHDTLAVDVGWWVAHKGVTDYRAQILLKNVTDIPVEQWKLRFRSTSLITDIQHGDWNRSGVNYEVTGRGWTKSIAPEETIWLTLSGVHGGQVDTLESCIFNGFPCTFVDPDDFVDQPDEPEPTGGLCAIVPVDGAGSQVANGSDGIRLDWTPTSFWPTGYTYTIEILNDSDDAIRNWELNFTLPSAMSITQMWNADYSTSGGRVTVTPQPHNSCIEPGAFVQIGFEGAHDGLPEPPSNCQFSGDDCTFARMSSVSTSIEGNMAEKPIDQFDLSAPYPNPFSTSSKIPFRVAETQAVHVTLWDMQGREVATLYTGLATAGQIYEIDVPSGTLQSGSYMIRLTGESGAGVTTPVMLIR
jgi:hypothetical protein